MHVYTSKTTVNFENPVALDSFDEMLPAGVYVVETVKEHLQGSLVPAYRRIETRLHLHPKQGLPRILMIDPKELEAVLRLDQVPQDLSSLANVNASAENIFRPSPVTHDSERFEFLPRDR